MDHDPADELCPVCHNQRWVCEEHPDRPWPSGCDCGGAGEPCPLCNYTVDRDNPPLMPPGYRSFME